MQIHDSTHLRRRVGHRHRTLHHRRHRPRTPRNLHIKRAHHLWNRVLRPFHQHIQADGEIRVSLLHQHGCVGCQSAITLLHKHSPGTSAPRSQSHLLSYCQWLCELGTTVRDIYLHCFRAPRISNGLRSVFGHFCHRVADLSCFFLHIPEVAVQGVKMLLHDLVRRGRDSWGVSKR